VCEASERELRLVGLSQQTKQELEQDSRSRDQSSCQLTALNAA
jgi:hypothetical protein